MTFKEFTNSLVIPKGQGATIDSWVGALTRDTTRSEDQKIAALRRLLGQPEDEPAAATVTVTAPRLDRVRFDRVRLHPTYLAIWRAVYEMVSRKRDRAVSTTLAAIGERAAAWLGGRSVATDTVRCGLVYLDSVGAVKVESWPKVTRGSWGKIKCTRARVSAPVLTRAVLAEIQARIDANRVTAANPKEAKRFQDRQRARTVSGAHAPGVVKSENSQTPGITG
jgi:hypothetical protein